MYPVIAHKVQLVSTTASIENIQKQKLYVCQIHETNKCAFIKFIWWSLFASQAVRTVHLL